MSIILGNNYLKSNCFILYDFLRIYLKMKKWFSVFYLVVKKKKQKKKIFTSVTLALNNAPVPGENITTEYKDNVLHSNFEQFYDDIVIMIRKNKFDLDIMNNKNIINFINNNSHLITHDNLI